MGTRVTEAAAPLADDLVIACLADEASFGVGRVDSVPQLRAETFDIALQCAARFGRQTRVDVWHIGAEAVCTRVAHFR